MVPAQELTKEQCAFIRQIIKEITITQKAVSKWQKPGQSSLENSFVPGEKVEVGLPYGSGRNRTIKWHLGTVVEVRPDFMLVQLERYRATITWGELREGRIKVKSKLVRLEVGGMGQSGHNTSISKNRQGCRLPYESPSVGDGYASPGPVVTYRLDPEEIAARYGPPREIKERPLSRKEINYAMEHSTSLAEAAKLLKVSKKHLVTEMARYDIAVPELWKEEEAVTEIIAPAEIREEVQAEKPTPLEALEKGIPLEQAQRMRPEDLTKEVAEKLLAAGVSKRQITRLYGYRSPSGPYYKLKSWGLVGETEQGSPKYQNIKREEKQGIPVTQAFSRLNIVRENIKCLARILQQEDIVLTDDVAANLEELRSKYAAEAARIEEVLAETRVVI